MVLASKGTGCGKNCNITSLDGSYQGTVACRYDSGREKVTGERNLRSLK